MLEILNNGQEIKSTNFFDLRYKDAFLSMNKGAFRLLIPTVVLSQIDDVICDLEYFELEKEKDIFYLYLFEKGNNNNPFLLKFEPSLRDFSAINSGETILYVYTVQGLFKKVKGCVV